MLRIPKRPLTGLHRRVVASSEPSKVEQAASDACTRSGLFALALSLTLGATVPIWSEQRDVLVLGQYIVDRLELQLTLDELEADATWQKKLAADQSLRDLPIVALAEKERTGGLWREANADANTISLTLRLEIVNATPSTGPQEKATQEAPQVTLPEQGAQAAPEGGAPPARLLPPTDLKIEFPPIYFRTLESLLKRLDDNAVLEQARRAHGAYDLMIYRWQRKSGALREAQSRTIGIRSGDAAGLAGLTLDRVRELGAFEYPKLDMSAKIDPGRGKQVDLTIGGLPRNLVSAAIAIEVMLVFVVAYFAAFLKEAISSRQFPAQGTLFAALSRSRVTAGISALALFAPAVAAVPTAAESRQPVLVTLAAVICALSLWLLRMCAPLWSRARPKPLSSSRSIHGPR
jgi:hypothetical protein